MSGPRAVFIWEAEDVPAASIGAVLDTLGIAWQSITSLDAVRQQAPAHPLLFLPLSAMGWPEIAALRGQLPLLDVVVVGTQGTVAEATTALRHGALDYLSPPIGAVAVARAVERWQLRRTTGQEAASLSELITLMELGRTLTSTLRLEEVYEQIIEQVERTFQPDTVSLMLLNRRAERLRLVVQRGLPAKATPGTEVSLEESIAGRVVQEGRPQLLLGGLQGTEFEALARRRSTIASAMSIPLQVQGKTLGVLNVNRGSGRPSYTERDANLLYIFAAQIAIALQNAQLYESLRDERDRIVAAQEEVRRELARDLHDGLTQVLASLAVNLDHLRGGLQKGTIDSERAMQHLGFLRKAVRQAIQDARTLTFGLRPLVLETQGLVPALERYLEAIRESDPRTHYHLDRDGCLPTSRLAPSVARMVFAVVQEAVSNARKHARAMNVWVSLTCDEGSDQTLMRAAVRDDGVGFDVAQVEGEYAERLSFGLHNMKERAALIDATLRLSSGPEGTTVELLVPKRVGQLRGRT